MSILYLIIKKTAKRSFFKIESSTVYLIYAFYPYREKIILNKKI